MTLSKPNLLGAFAALGLTVSGAAAAAPAPASAGLALDGVTVVDVRTGALARDREVLIEGGRITRIVRAHALKPAPGITVAAAAGKYLVPGYLDMHSHALNSPAPQLDLQLMLAYGITGFRQMSGSPALLQARREGRLPIPQASPALLATPGTVLAGGAAVPAPAMVAEVDRQKAQGADFIKVIDLGSPAFFAAMDEATKVGLPFDGHLTNKVDVREAARRGMRGVEHVGPNDAVLLGCSSREAQIRAQIATGSVKPAATTFNLPLPVLRRLTAEPLLSLQPADLALIKQTEDSYDDAKCRDLARLFAAQGTWQTPTLARLHAMQFSDDPAYPRDPNLKYVSAGDRQLWVDIARDFTAKPPPERKAILAALWPMQLHLVKLLDQAGVKMMTGTDAGAQWLVPGASLHQEFDLTAQAGVPPLHVLQMATLNGAEFLHRERDMGTVEPGKAADLVVLAGDPTASVQNMHRIDAVVRAGRYYSRADLDGLMRQAEQAPFALNKTEVTTP